MTVTAPGVSYAHLSVTSHAVAASSTAGLASARAKSIRVDRLRGLIERIHPEDLGRNLRELETRSDRITRWLERAGKEEKPLGLSPADILEMHRRLLGDFAQADEDLDEALKRKRSVRSILDDIEEGRTALVEQDDEPAPRATRAEMLRLLEAMIGLCDASDVIAHRVREELARQGRSLERFEHDR